jgi:hypothetical protein
MPPQQTISLLCHPATICPVPVSIGVHVSSDEWGGLSLGYELKGQLDRLRIPSPLPAELVDGLWRHTCFEAFIAVAGRLPYREFNFSPSGQWAAYAFRGYREREEIVRHEVAPRVSVLRLPDRLELRTVLGPPLLPPAAEGEILQLGLAAVVQAADGSRSYWAIAHAAARPDFHIRDTMSLSLAANHAGIPDGHR